MNKFKKLAKSYSGIDNYCNPSNGTVISYLKKLTMLMGDETEKDNPVPSIDKWINEKATELLRSNNISDYQRFIAELLINLQNGVETDKKEPNKCPKCNKGYMVGYKNQRWCNNCDYHSH